MFNTPILFIIFKRLETTKQVFSVLQQIKPRFLYVAADGPRHTVEGEKLLCAEVRQWVLDNVNWQCDVKTLFRDKNFGCGRAVSSAITWLFDNVEQGIILEDDCVPSLSFFPFCEELLEKYKNDERIYQISGHNPLVSINSRFDYFFTRIQYCWGWATWKRAWKQYSFDIIGFNDFIRDKKINTIFKNKYDQLYWLNIFKKMGTHEIDTWDYQWIYTIFNNNGLYISPKKNLISNMGFNQDATHTFDNNSKLFNQKKFDLNIIRHPTTIKVDYKLVRKISKYGFFIENYFDKLFKRVLNIFKNKDLTVFKKIMLILKKIRIKCILFLFPELKVAISSREPFFDKQRNIKYFYPYLISDDVEVGAYTYIQKNSNISKTTIGKYCSIGPNFLCGWGIHPTAGISTSPMFYSTQLTNIISLSQYNKIIERKRIIIGNDVFIGANVTVLDGVIIHDGAVIGAGAVVSKDIPPYAIAVGCPIKILKYRFDELTIQELLDIKWWDFPEDKLQLVEKYFFDIQTFIKICKDLKE
ncbi:nucleotide-diphospho-sugar transferase domain protein [Treponema primitia ZAS-2]|uniref:Nucleotide-diphospho-sugar transferase domain protein n=1 Tax=Treponema primitia (strain ATCC BAA-887 / DSM 12427 / ZAS-2) TaxID=545694 RepID=F5YHJ8_TREPZ|nr:CatB-related O-acetyltransferase [Treponema primitia]AEF86703.1 nucleotide-diphospho-sugar transferase domain protein [Treponema primitia ZAS-2]